MTLSPVVTRSVAAADPVDDELDVEPVARIVEGAEDAIRTFLAQLPNVAAGLVVLAVFVVLARLAKWVTRRVLLRATDRSPSFANVISGVVRGLVLLLGILVGIVVAVPGVDAGAIVGAFGISSVAIGFAFRDILQNTLAGLLLLFRQPFEVGDEITVDAYTGTVEAITIRETRIKTFDGRRVLVPNQDVYSTAVEVQTAFPAIRTTVVVGVDYETDLARARRVALEAVLGVEGVLAEPPPEAFYNELNVSSVDLDVRYWSASTEQELRAVRDRVIATITDAYREAGIAMPADIVEVEVRSSVTEAVRAARS